MKTTVDLSGPLLRAAKQAATREKTTLRALIEEGLRLVLAQRKRTTPFTLRDASVDGEGLQPGMRDGDWATVRDLIYEGRGS